MKLKLSILVISMTYASAALSCVDNTERFEVNRPARGDTAIKSCWHAINNPWDQCSKPEMKANCPLTCNACPNDVTCRLKADLQFSPNYSEGVHKDSLQVEKAEDGEVCYSENQKTDWGCNLVGDAFFNNTSGVRKAEIARVFNAGGGNYTLRVSHDFLETDVLQSTTVTKNSLANLIVKVNGKRLGKFKHKGKYQETHEGVPLDVSPDNLNVGFINPEFNGDYSVKVNCNDECECTVERVEQTCKLQAQLAFPGFTEKSDNEYGYHSDVLTIKNDYSEICSYWNNVTSWCYAYGDAVIYRSEPDYYDYNQAFTALIPDAADKEFSLTVDHYGVAGYYSTPAVLNLFANGIPFFNGAKHAPDASPCGGGKYEADVVCDGSCNCELFPVIMPICQEKN